MVTDQLSLLDIATSTPAPEPTPEPDAPRCGMCARPARWNRVQEKYAQYCAGRACDNRERTCQHCDKPFTIRVNGAGNKYCSAECKRGAYYRHPERTSPTPQHCAWCPKPAPRGSQQRAGTWPYICQECIDPIRHLADRLKRHKVPHERVRQLLDDPGCEVCGTDLIARTRDAKGRLTSQLVVDHDHDCCIGEHSCGRCVRGLLCLTCNTAVGMVRNSPSTARRLADYLECWTGA